MKCLYCQTESINAEMFVVRRATKPKGFPHRWQRIGYCCEACEEQGQLTDIEYKQEPLEP